MPRACLAIAVMLARALPALAVPAAAPPTHSSLRFTEITAESGPGLAAYRMTSGSNPSEEILDVNGGGVALFDYDNDGDLDLFLANGATRENTGQGPGSRLFANDGRGRFSDVTAAAGITLRRWAMGVAAGDYDGDGWDDLYVTCFGANVLLHNEAAVDTAGEAAPTLRRFRDVTAQAGVGDARWGTSAAWGDLDSDGDLDLYVANYLEFDPRHPPDRSKARFLGAPVMAGPAGLVAQADVLYENLGDGRFRDVTIASGVGSVKPGYGLVAAIFDADEDGRPDIFVGNDSTPDFLFSNRTGDDPHGGGMKFREVGARSGLCCNGDGGTQATMGIALADVNGDGRVDPFTTAFSSDPKTLHLGVLSASGAMSWEDRSGQFGLGMVSRPFLSWGAGFFDFDLDGDEDLFVSNGHVYPEAAREGLDAPYLQPALLFERSGARFARCTSAGEAIEHAVAGRAVAFGDLDGDGDPDVVQTTLNGPVRVLRNDSARPAGPGVRRPIAIALRQPGKNPRAVGARVEVDINGSQGRSARQVRWLAGGSFQSTDAPECYVAIDPEAGPYRIRVTWPGAVTSETPLVLPARGARLIVTRP